METLSNSIKTVRSTPSKLLSTSQNTTGLISLSRRGKSKRLWAGLSGEKDQQLPITTVRWCQLVSLAVKGNLIGLHWVQQTGGLSNRMPRSKSPFLGRYQDVQYIPWICETFFTRHVRLWTWRDFIPLFCFHQLTLSFLFIYPTANQSPLYFVLDTIEPTFPGSSQAVSAVDSLPQKCEYASLVIAVTSAGQH